jgi:hypothetical protein
MESAYGMKQELEERGLLRLNWNLDSMSSNLSKFLTLESCVCYKK